MARIESDRNSPSRAMGFFTDREDHQDVFQRYLHASLQPPVLSFYGVGGAGKTWLLLKLKEHLPDEIPTAFLDFDRERAGRTFTVDPSAGLQAIRHELNVPCPRFDVALNLMLYKQGVREETNLLLDVASEITSSSGSKAITDLATAGLHLFASTAAISVSAVPGASPLIKLFSKPLLKKLKGSSVEKMLGRKEIVEVLHRLRPRSPQEIGDELVSLLADDLRESLPSHLDHAIRAVIFLDTFEAIGSDLQNEQHRHQSEAWVRSVASEFDFALVVVAGQNRLNWEAIDPAWSRHLEQHLVGGLSESDARLFLSRCTITEIKLQNAILATAREESGGHHCFTLGLCADIVYTDRKHNVETSAESMKLTPGDWNALARRFIKSLGSSSLVPWIAKLAITPRFDEDAAKYAFSEHATPAQEAAWEDLLRYSFLERSIEQNGWYTIRSQMRRALAQQLDPQKITRYQTWWQAYWQTRSASQTDEYASLAWYHAWTLKPEESTRRWNELAEGARKAIPPRMMEHRSLLAWWNPLDSTSAQSNSLENLARFFSLGVELTESSLGNREDNLRRAIECYQAALTVYTEKNFPQDWAATQNNLGLAWSEIPTGDRGENLRRAIECYQAALTVRTEQDFPQDWAMTQNNLGSAWSEMPTGSRGDNLRRAIVRYQAALKVYTEKNFPQDWAATQNNLGLACSEIPTGDRGDNLRQAIECYQAALTVYTEHDFPRRWATIQNNLGNAWSNMPTGDLGENLRRAIECYQAALTVRTEQDFPQQWAPTQNNLGATWGNMPIDDLGENLRRAIECYEAALMVYTEQDFPQQWAATQDNLGTAWSEIPTGDRGENLRRSIDCHQAALTVRTEQDFPQDWATTQNNLGAAWSDMPTGDREENLRRAVECYQAAFTVYTELDFPQDWAMTQNNLGNAWSNMPTGDREKNLRRAIECYQAALTVYTEQDFPQQWAMLQKNLQIAIDRLEEFTKSSSGSPLE